MGQQNVFGRGAVRTALMIGGAAITLCAPAAAQNAVHTYDIPAMATTDALNTFAHQSGIRILFPYQAIASQNSSAVRGTLTEQAALSRLIAGAPLRLVSYSNGVMTLGNHPATPSARSKVKNDPPPMAPRAVADPVADSGGQEAIVPSEIVVTGSRLQTNLKTPTAVTEVTSQQLFRASPATLATQLRQLPALANTAGPQTYSGVRGGGQSFLNLRGLDPVRTLTLVNGQRFTPTSLLGTVDVNMLPSALISKIDVVTGGASAAYGSDAVAGVVNIILDDNFNGFKANGQYGLTTHGDRPEYLASMAAGSSFAQGRGHIEIGADYYSNGAVPGGSRAWQRSAQYILPNPSGTPNLVVASNVHSPVTYGGLIVGGIGRTAAANASFNGIMFGPGGVPQAYNFGTLTTSGRQSGGDGLDTGSYQDIDRPLNRVSGYGRVSFDVSPNLNLYADALAGHSQITYVLGPQTRLGASAITITRDNPFIPATIAAQMDALHLTGFKLARADSEPGLSGEDHTNTTLRFTGGFKARLGNWKWDGYAAYGTDTEHTWIFNNEIKSNYALALDVVTGPTGTPICRSTLTNPTNGCQPFNPFGVGSPSAASTSYVNGTLTQANHISETVAATNFAGNLATLWAGDLAVATGLEYRHEHVDSVADPLSNQNAYRLGNFRSWAGSYDIAEGYVEAELPILRAKPLVDLLSINGAVREAHYSNSGWATTWKAGAVWQVTPSLMIRGTRSRDIRAPNLTELYTPGQRSSASPIDPYKGNVQLLNVDIFVTGNPNLKPEIADTTTAGIAYRPSFVPGLSMTLDYYNISVNNLIGTIAAQTRLNQCFAGIDVDCAGLIRDASGNLTQIIQRNINLSSLKAAGFDFELNYAVHWSLPGKLNLRALVTIPTQLRIASPGTPTVDYVGYNGGVSAAVVSGAGSTPRYSGQVQLDYQIGDWDLFAQTRYIASGKYFNAFAPQTLSLTRINPAAYLDLNIERKLPFLKKASVYLNIRNIFDSDPIFDPLAGGEFMTNTLLYDQLGRTIRGGFRIQY